MLVLLIVYVMLMISLTPEIIGLCLGSGWDSPYYKDCLLEIILLEIANCTHTGDHCQLMFV